MNKRRLLTLANYLDKVPRVKFDYSEWVSYGWQGKLDFSCGATACALGHACTIPSLRRAGLELHHDDYTIAGEIRLKHDHTVRYTDAAAKVFGITTEEAHYLFTPHYPWVDLPRSPYDRATPKEVAKHIRRFVKWKESHVDKRRRNV